MRHRKIGGTCAHAHGVTNFWVSASSSCYLLFASLSVSPILSIWNGPVSLRTAILTVKIVSLLRSEGAVRINSCYASVAIASKRSEKYYRWLVALHNKANSLTTK